MADNNLPLQITVEQSGEKVSEQNNSGSFRVAAATALLALSLATGNPAKAEQPAQPTQLAAVTTPAASVPTAAKEYGQMTQDGRKFFDLKPEDVKKLSRPEKEEYYEWKNTQLDATVNQKLTEEKKLDATVNQNNQEISEMARRNFPIYLATVKSGGNLKQVDIYTKKLIQYVAQHKIPPELAKDAEYLLKYI